MQNEYHFQKNVRSIKTTLGLTWVQYISIFGLTSKEAEKYLLGPKGFPLKYAMNFCEHFGLDLENIFSESFDVKAFARNYFKQAPVLPSHYQFEKNSRVITLINFVNGLDNSGLHWLNELIFRRLQIPQSLLLYPELEIPVKLIVDYLELVEKFQNNLKVMKSCGEEGIFKLNKQFGFVTKDSFLSHEFYDEFFTDHIRQFDKSYNYQVISFKDHQLQVKCTQREELKEIYQSKIMSNKALINYKSGIGSGLSSLFGQETSQSTILKVESDSGYDLISIQIPKQRSFSPQSLH